MSACARIAIFLLPVTALASVAALGPVDALAEDPLLVRFRDEYPAAAKRLEAFYTDLQMSEVQKIHRETGVETLSDVRYFSRDGWGRVDTLYPDRGHASVVTRDGRSFKVQRRNNRDSYEVLEVLAQRSERYATNVRTSARLPSAPYCMMDVRIIDFVSRPSFTINRIAEVRQDGKDLLKIEWQDAYVNRGGQPLTRVGWFLFAPNEAWVLRGYAFAYHITQKSRLRADIDYGEKSDDGIPLVARAEYFRQVGEAREPRLTVERTGFLLEPAATEAFELSAFSISTP